MLVVGTTAGNLVAENQVHRLMSLMGKRSLRLNIEAPGNFIFNVNLKKKRFAVTLDYKCRYKETRVLT